MYKLLKNWCEENKAVEKTTRAFWNYFSTYKKEEPEEFYSVFENRKIELFFDKVCYELNLPKFDQEFVSISLDIFVNDENIGWFKQIYFLDGTEYDEHFVLY